MFSIDQISKLRRAGFIDKEINEWQWAVSENGKPYVTTIDTPVWEDTIQTRRDLRDELIKKKYNSEERIAFFERYYERFDKADPFDWLKKEYRNPKKAKWKDARRKKFRDRINRRLGRLFEEREEMGFEPVKKKKQKREKIAKVARERQRKTNVKYLREGFSL